MAIRLFLPVMSALVVVALAACSESPMPNPEPTTQDASASTPRIAFHSNRDGNWEIYVMNADGSGQTRLTDNPARDIRPSWSPDGRHIAFSSDRDDPDSDDNDRIMSIYVMNVDGSDETRLTDNSATDHASDWSPN